MDTHLPTRGKIEKMYHFAFPCRDAEETRAFYEDLLGLTEGGDDGHGHLGYAGTAGVLPFGKDVFNAKSW